DSLATAANAIARGRLDRRVEVEGTDEFGRLGVAFNEMADQLEARLEELDAERARVRDATVRFGEALAATHDVDQLLRVIVETVVETTGATGGIVVGLGGEIVQSGTLSDRGETFELPLTAGRQSFGTLTLSGRGFSVEQRRTAASLVAHAAIAPDGTRIHVTVSFGVAAFPEASVGEGLVAAADGALYEAKRTGKNRVVTARPRARQA